MIGKVLLLILGIFLIIGFFTFWEKLAERIKMEKFRKGTTARDSAGQKQNNSHESHLS
jgi:hypothetical protein